MNRENTYHWKEPVVFFVDQGNNLSGYSRYQALIPIRMLAAGLSGSYKYSIEELLNLSSQEGWRIHLDSIQGKVHIRVKMGSNDDPTPNLRMVLLFALPGQITGTGIDGIPFIDDPGSGGEIGDLKKLIKEINADGDHYGIRFIDLGKPVLKEHATDTARYEFVFSLNISKKLDEKLQNTLFTSDDDQSSPAYRAYPYLYINDTSKGWSKVAMNGTPTVQWTNEDLVSMSNLSEASDIEIELN
jgi:hypothetical protein